jgi:hypothetical protein
MIAFLVAELGDWKERHMRKTVCLSAAFLALVGLVGPLQPLILALAGTLIFLVVAWAEGFNPPPELSLRVDPLTFPAKSVDIAAGKALSSLILWLDLGFALSPILVASVIAWGIPGGTVLLCLLCWLSAYLLASSINFLSKLLFARTEGLVGLSLYLLWLFSSFFTAGLEPSNPFIQAWSLLKLEGGRTPIACMCAEIAAAAALFACSALVIGLKKRNRDA